MYISIYTYIHSMMGCHLFMVKSLTVWWWTPRFFVVKSPFESLRPKRKINGPGTTHPAAIPRRGWRRSGKKKSAVSPGFHVGWSITQFVGDDSKLSQVTKLATSYPHYIIYFVPKIILIIIPIILSHCTTIFAGDVCVVCFLTSENLHLYSMQLLVTRARNSYLQDNPHHWNTTSDDMNFNSAKYWNGI